MDRLIVNSLDANILAFERTSVKQLHKRLHDGNGNAEIVHK